MRVVGFCFPERSSGNKEFRGKLGKHHNDKCKANKMREDFKALSRYSKGKPLNPTPRIPYRQK